MIIKLLVLVFFSFLSLSAESVTNKKDTTSFYEDLWDKVKTLEGEGKTRSALKTLKEIYNRASIENNSSMYIKSVLHILKYSTTLEEDEFYTIFNEMRKEVSSASPPTRQILHSMLAEMYWMYYQRNRPIFLSRTRVEGKPSPDVRKWDLSTIVNYSMMNFAKSLENPESLKKIEIKDLEPILSHQKSTDSLRPTLYDFLLHRVVDFYSSGESGLTVTRDRFYISKDSISYKGKKDYNLYHSSPEIFLSSEISNLEPKSFTYMALTNLKNLMKFRWEEYRNADSGQKNTVLSAFLDVDLKRHQFIYKNSIDPDKKKYYIEALEELKKLYSSHPVSAEISYLIAKEFSVSASSYNPLQGRFHSDDARKAVDLCTAANFEFPKSFGGKNCEALLSSLKEKQIGLALESHQIPGKKFPILLKYKNLDSATFFLFPFLEKDIESIRNLYEEEKKKLGYIPYESIVLKYFSSKAPIQNFTISLQNPRDYNSHSSEIVIPELSSGEYILFASAEGGLNYENNGIAFDSFRVTNLAYINRNLDNQFQFHLLNRKTGAPIPDANVTQLETIYDRQKRTYSSKIVRNLKSDINGGFSVPKTGKENLNYFFEVKALGETYYIGNPLTPLSDSIRGIFYQGIESTFPPGSESPQTKTFFFTDRSIYRPGQKVYFKTILLEIKNKTNRTLPNEDITVQLLDVNQTKVGELKLKTNDFGSASGSFTLPTSGLRGQFSLITPNFQGGRSISVEEYKRPKFKVTLEKPNSEAKIGDTIKIKGNAGAYSGAPISNAKMKYTVKRNAIFPVWRYRFAYLPPVSPEAIISSGESETDEKGNFKIAFDAIPDETIDPIHETVFRYQISVEVTDTNGETNSQNITIPIGTVSLRLQINIPKYVLRSNFRGMKIESQNLSGQSVATTGKLEITKLSEPRTPYHSRIYGVGDRNLYTKDEWKSLVPEHPYEREDEPEFYDRLETVYSGEFQTGDTNLQTDTGSWKPGLYSVVATGKDSFGRIVKDKSFFTLVDNDEKKNEFSDPALFFVVQNPLEPGDVLRIFMNNRFKEKALLELELDGKIFKSLWVNAGSSNIFEYTLTENERGNFGVHYSFVYNNKLYTHSETIQVPRTDKELKVSLATHRSTVQPGEEETWNIKIEGNKKDIVLAEMVATMYDASLDSFMPHRFDFDIFTQYQPYLRWQSENGFRSSQGYIFSEKWNTVLSPTLKQYRSLNWYGFEFSYNRPVLYKRAYSPVMEDRIADSSPESYRPAPVMKKESSPAEAPQKSKPEESPKPQIELRSDFRETAFFYPHLNTDEKGNILISFKFPDSLTTWKFLGFAHSSDLRYGFISDEIKAIKKFMVIPGLPRFFREGDTLELAVKLTNQSEENLWGKADLIFLDPATGKDLSSQFYVSQKNSSDFETSFEVKKNLSQSISWKIKIPRGLSSIMVRTEASSGKYTDGEETILPILTNRILVTETLPLWMGGTKTKSFSFKKLLDSSDSKELKHHSLSLEFTSNPVWLTIASLPYLAEYPYECMEQTFSRYYANSISKWIVDKNPEIEKVFQKWKSAANKEPNALLSNLEKNQDLKSLFLEETPWVLDGKRESENKLKIANLFQKEKITSESQKAILKLKDNQTLDGSFSWFKGMQGDRYITQHIISGFGHLKKIGIPMDNTVQKMVASGIRYLDKKMREDYEYLREQANRKKISLSDNHLNPYVVHYLYTRSFFSDNKISEKNKEAFDFYITQAKNFKFTTNYYSQGMLALALSRAGDKKNSKKILESLKENAISNPELGTYWKTKWSYYWYELPVETQSLLIECFFEIEGDSDFLNKMKLWLLKHKQTNDWHTTKATTDAIYSLLLGDTSWKKTKIPEISLGDTVISSDTPNFKTEAGTGYFKKSFSSSQIKPSMGSIQIKSQSQKPAFGGVYWQYFQTLDKITPAETPLKLEKKLFLLKSSSKGNSLSPIQGESLHVGDTVRVRIELSTDRDMEYIHLKDMRASCLEPTQVLSGYRFQDGLGYYESTKDASVNFFIDRLPRGVYVLEYSLKVTQKGNFSNGITTVQSMYAPEFASHSEGIRFSVN